MIWLYILAAIVAQAIVVVLLVEYINRRGQPAVVKQEESNLPAPSETDAQPIVSDQSDNAVGVSNFSISDLRAMMEDVVKPLRECVETLMDAKDAEFDVKEEATLPAKRMSQDAEAAAWEDHRDEEAILDNDDHSVAAPNPLASGVDFDSITKATAIVQSDEPQPIGELQFAMNVFRTVDGTQFSGCLPDALLEKLYECHRKVEMNENAFREEDSMSETSKPPFPKDSVKKSEVKTEPIQETVKESEVKEAPAPRFRMEFLRKPSNN